MIRIKVRSLGQVIRERRRRLDLGGSTQAHQDQGMSAAARQAHLLRELLSDHLSQFAE